MYTVDGNERGESERWRERQSLGENTRDVIEREGDIKVDSRLIIAMGYGLE